MKNFIVSNKKLEFFTKNYYKINSVYYYYKKKKKKANLLLNKRSLSKEVEGIMVRRRILAKKRMKMRQIRFACLKTF